MAKATTKFFELIIGQKDGEVHSGDVPVRWCVSNGLVEHLQEQGNGSPHVLLVPVNPDVLEEDGSVRYIGQEVGERKLVPMKDLMTYVRFNRPGKNRLLAFIVFGSSKALKRIFLEKWSGDPATTILHDGEVSMSDRAEGWVYTEQHVDVNIDIPEGVFGKEPAPWRKWFANLWMRGTLEDECHFRQRFWLLGVLKIWPVAARAIWFFVVRGGMALSLFLLGYKGVDWNPVIHPFDGYTRWIHQKCENEDNFFLNLFKVDRNDENNIIQALSSFSGVFVSPLFFFALAAVLVIASMIADFGFWTGLMIALVMVVGVAVVFGVFIGLLMLFEETRWGQRFGDWFDGHMLRFTKWLEARQIQANSLDDLPELICPKNDINVIAAQFSDIPWNRRSIKLWCESIKHAVCKPMAR